MRWRLASRGEQLAQTIGPGRCRRPRSCQAATTLRWQPNWLYLNGSRRTAIRSHGSRILEVSFVVAHHLEDFVCQAPEIGGPKIEIIPMSNPISPTHKALIDQVEFGFVSGGRDIKGGGDIREDLRRQVRLGIDST